MKPYAMIVFLIIVFTVHLLVNIYIFLRGWQALAFAPSIRPYYIALFVVLFLSYIIARALENYIGYTIAGVFNWIGSFWFAAMLYFFLLILCIDIIRLLNYWFHFLPAIFYADYAKTKILVMLGSIMVVFLLMIYGFINASQVKISKLDLKLDKKAGQLKSLNIVMLSDIHLGTIIGAKKLKKITKTINTLSPDIVLFAGDLVDENIRHVIKQNLGEHLENITSKYGSYAVPGNHEFIGGANAAIAYLEKHSVKFLLDSAVLIDSVFWLAGRNDKDMKRFTGKERQPLNSLLEGVEKTLPVILLDHQPFYLEKTAEAGVDLQLSGHTHNGQIFPLNLITRAIYNPDWGYRKIGNSHFYISCGVGTWGPPLRIGNHPEIVNITLHFI
jgi:hypothetical protein